MNKVNGKQQNNSTVTFFVRTHAQHPQLFALASQSHTQCGQTVGQQKLVPAAAVTDNHSLKT